MTIYVYFCEIVDEDNPIFYCNVEFNDCKSIVKATHTFQDQIDQKDQKDQNQSCSSENLQLIYKGVFISYSTKKQYDNEMQNKPQFKLILHCNSLPNLPCNSLPKIDSNNMTIEQKKELDMIFKDEELKFKLIDSIFGTEGDGKAFHMSEIKSETLDRFSTIKNKPDNSLYGLINQTFNYDYNYGYNKEDSIISGWNNYAEFYGHSKYSGIGGYGQVGTGKTMTAIKIMDAFILNKKANGFSGMLGASAVSGKIMSSNMIGCGITEMAKKVKFDAMAFISGYNPCAEIESYSISNSMLAHSLTPLASSLHSLLNQYEMSLPSLWSKQETKIKKFMALYQCSYEQAYHLFIIDEKKQEKLKKKVFKDLIKYNQIKTKHQLKIKIKNPKLQIHP